MSSVFVTSHKLYYSSQVKGHLGLSSIQTFCLRSGLTFIKTKVFMDAHDRTSINPYSQAISTIDLSSRLPDSHQLETRRQEIAF